MSDQNPAAAAPGWYPDPQNPGQRRYWDGAAWAPPQAAPQAPTPSPAGPPPGGVAQPPTSTNAIVGLILAIGSWFICPLIAAIAALLFARSSTKEIEASQGRVGGAGLNTATRIVAWINIGVSIVAGLVFAFLAVVGVFAVSEVANSVDPKVNQETGLSDGRYVMDPNASLVINDECTFSGPVYDAATNSLVKDTRVYGVGPSCVLGTNTAEIDFVVTGGVAQIIAVRG